MRMFGRLEEAAETDTQNTSKTAKAFMCPV
jgi:hypothetical protein